MHPKKFRLDDLNIIIDGMNIFYRVYHTHRKLSSKGGLFTGAAYGFLYYIVRLFRTYNSRNIIICWESEGKKRKRKNVKKDYKGNRENRMDDDIYSEFIPALKMTMDLLSEIGIPTVSVPGMEGDDAIYMLVRLLKRNIRIVSNDKDMLQLVNDDENVKVIRKVKDDTKLCDEQIVKDILGVEPKYVPMFLAMAGDASDNVKGIRGCGPKTASKIINGNDISTLNDIKVILNNDEAVKQFITSYNLVKLSKSNKNVKLNRKHFTSLKDKFDEEKVSNMLDDMEIKSISVLDLKLLSNNNLKKVLLEKL